VAQRETLADDTAVIDWLLEGDPAIRWQVMRDLLAAPEARWQAERRKVVASGWGAHFLSLQDAAGTWGRGIYTPKWTSTTYTLLTLRDLGLPGTNRAARRGARLAVEGLLGQPGTQAFELGLHRIDLCIAGMALSLASHFGIDNAGTELILAHVLEHQLDDGGWNCRCKHDRAVVHSSFHTTFNVLDGLQDHLDQGRPEDRRSIQAAQKRATELMLAHHLFRSDKTGTVISPHFLRFSYPPRWHYDVLRGLDYFQRIQAPRDARFGEAIELVLSKRRQDGTWPLQHSHAGKTFFQIEKAGQPSRWNTLRALRVLKWWGFGEFHIVSD
jgi:hypothetical protein